MKWLLIEWFISDEHLKWLTAASQHMHAVIGLILTSLLSNTPTPGKYELTYDICIQLKFDATCV